MLLVNLLFASSQLCSPNPHLQIARAALSNNALERAAQSLDRARAHKQGCRRDTIELWELKALLSSAQGDWGRCVRAFAVLSALEPSYTLSADRSETTRRCFLAAMRTPAQTRRLELKPSAQPKTLSRLPLSITVDLEDPLGLTKFVQVAYRRSGTKRFSTVIASADQRLGIVIPALSIPSSPQGYEIEYIVRAVDRAHGTLIERGPRTVHVQGDDSSGSPRGWWIFSALLITAALIGGVAAIARSQGADEMARMRPR